jgi:serine/threonine protein kinase
MGVSRQLATANPQDSGQPVKVVVYVTRHLLGRVTVDGTPFGRYRLVELLGRGGMGEVWRAYDTAIGRVVALKVLPAHLANDEIFQQRFRREARAAAGLDEPHVVPIHDFGEVDGRLYVTMRLIDGRDMEAILAGGPLEPARAVFIIEQVASALNAAHRIGLVHRDVKPSNILVGEDDFAYLIDFGIARSAGETSKLTDTGNVIGTWAYLAPERLSEGQVEPRADIYALTCVLHECLTGSQPFPSNSLEQQVAAHLSKPPPRPTELRHELPEGLDPVIAKGMAKDPGQRYSTTKELAAAARAAITDPIPKPPPGMRPRPAEPVNREGPTVVTPPTVVSLPTDVSPPTVDSPSTDVFPVPQVQPPRPDHPPRPVQPPQPARPVQPVQPAGGVSLTAPTEVHPVARPNQNRPVPNVPSPPDPVKKRKGSGIAIAAVVAAVCLITAAVAVVVMNRADSGSSVAGSPSTSSSAPPNSGPLTGVYRADFGPENGAAGEALDSGTFNIRSACRSNGCVAMAVTSQASVIGKTLVFDDVGGSWLSVGIANGSPQSVSPGLRKSCKDGTFVDIWEVFALQPKPNGTLSGQYTATSQHYCSTTRTVTFTRTGDVDVSSVPDPGSQTRRVTTPAEGLRGQYRRTFTWPGNRPPTVIESSVKTDCLRTGDRCMSYFHGKTGADPMIFADGKWAWRSDRDYDCTPTERAHSTGTAEYPLPPAAPNPIILLTGEGHSEVPPGTTCSGSFDFQSKYERIGD